MGWTPKRYGNSRCVNGVLRASHEERPARAALRTETALLHSSPHFVGLGLRAPRVGRMARRAGPATLWVARATHLSFRFVLGAPPTRRYLRALRLGSLYPNKRTAIPLESHYSLFFKQFVANGECNEPRRVAVHRVGWRRTARLCEPQKQQPIHHPNSVGFGLRAPGVGRTAQHAGPAVLRTARAQPNLPLKVHPALYQACENTIALAG